VEVGDAPDALSTLSGTELASRLSFALLGRSPSAAVLDQAAIGALDTPEGLRAAAQAMLADPEVQNFYAAFFRQWLGFNTLRPPVAPPEGWSDALLPELAAETDGVIRDHAWGGRSLLDVLTAPYTKVSASLADCRRRARRVAWTYLAATSAPAPASSRTRAYSVPKPTVI
jgi:hypothetical protein